MSVPRMLVTRDVRVVSGRDAAAESAGPAEVTVNHVDLLAPTSAAAACSSRNAWKTSRFDDSPASPPSSAAHDACAASADSGSAAAPPRGTPTTSMPRCGSMLDFVGEDERQDVPGANRLDFLGDERLGGEPAPPRAGGVR